MSDYEKQSIEAATAAIQRGHTDTKNLRELLIWTTATTTSPLIEAYFSTCLHDAQLLRALVAIALEGEDAGDAPWAAANTIVDFPSELLAEHKSALVELSNHQWSYLHTPAKQALAKLSGHDT